jgi:hypothetical protein
MSTTRSMRVTYSVAIAAFMLFNNNSYAQEEALIKDKLPAWTVGAHAGANLSNLILGKPMVNDNNSFGYGYDGGLSLEYGINSHLSLVAEGNFVNINSWRDEVQPLLPGSPLQTTTTTLYANFKKTQTFDYIQVPVMARVTFGDKFKYYINAGPYVGLLTFAQVKTSGDSYLYLDERGNVPYNENGSIHSFNATTDVTTKINTVDFGIAAGFGGGYTFGRHGIWLDARYNIGLVNIRTSSEINGQNQLEGFGLGLGYTYCIAQ